MDPVNSEGRRPARFSIQVPGMIRGRSIGLGSVMKGMTSAVKLRPCGGCNRRASKLDELMDFRGRSSAR